jgi:hypothetical protein
METNLLESEKAGIKFNSTQASRGEIRTREREREREGTGEM